MSDIIESGIFFGEPKNRTPATEATLRRLTDAQLAIVDQSLTYAGGSSVIAFPRPLRDVSLFIHPSAGSIGVDYTGDDTPSAGGNWIAIDAGEVSAGSNIVFLGPITGIRLRPIAAGAAATYVVRA